MKYYVDTRIMEIISEKELNIFLAPELVVL